MMIIIIIIYLRIKTDCKGVACGALQWRANAAAAAAATSALSSAAQTWPSRVVGEFFASWHLSLSLAQTLDLLIRIVAARYLLLVLRRPLLARSHSVSAPSASAAPRRKSRRPLCGHCGALEQKHTRSQLHNERTGRPTDARRDKLESRRVRASHLTRTQMIQF